MRDDRPDSEQLLKKLKYEEEQSKKKKEGKLKIFLGYAAGSGKTYAMLEAAHEAVEHGIDLVAGYIEPHARPDTQKMAEGLETLPPKMVEYRGVHLREFDIDAALERKPKIILVDELAHTNAPGCRNEKRYQDVQELLRAGINVFTTMNIQHIESLNDIVGNITNIEVRERIPDSVFDHAEQVEVIDIEPEDLIERMKEGKIYKEAQAERALQNFFREEKLVALREIALRRTADRVNRIAKEERNAFGSMNYYTGEHVLTCVSPADSSDKVIRTAARLAYAFHAEFTAICVETPELQEADEKTKKALRNHLELAKMLGAKIVTVFGSDIGGQIAEYAIVSNVSKIVIGRTNHRVWEKSPRQAILEKLNDAAPNIDVYIIPDMRHEKKRKIWMTRSRTSAGKVFVELGEITCVMLLTTLIAYIMKRWSFPESYLITFAILFIVGLFTANMTRKLKQQNVESAKKAFRTEILLENSQKLRRCKTEEEVWNQLAKQVGKLLDLSLIIYPVKEDGVLDEPRLFPRKGVEAAEMGVVSEPQEQAVAQWVVANHHRAGACTHTLPSAKAMYLPIQGTEEVKGVIGIVLEERRQIQEFKYGLLIAMLNETGVKLQNSFIES